MIYDGYSNNGATINLEADLSCEGVRGAYEIAEEAILMEHEIFMKIMDQDFAEGYYRVNSSIVSESQLESIQEASVSEIVDKVKEFIIAVGKKILGIIENIINKIKMLCTRDGKVLVSKYSKKVMENLTSGKLSKMKYKYAQFTPHAVIGGSKTIENTRDPKDATDLKPYTADQKEELRDSIYNDILGGNFSGTDSEFKKEFEDKLFSDEGQKEGISATEITDIETCLKQYKKTVKNVEDSRSTVKKDVKTLQSEADRIKKDALNDKNSDNRKNGTIRASRLSTLASVWSGCYTKAYSVYLAALKKNYQRCRSIYIKCATYGGKAENTVLGLAIEEASNFEVDMEFAE